MIISIPKAAWFPCELVLYPYRNTITATYGEPYAQLVGDHLYELVDVTLEGPINQQVEEALHAVMPATYLHDHPADRVYEVPRVLSLALASDMSNKDEVEEAYRKIFYTNEYGDVASALALIQNVNTNGTEDLDKFERIRKRGYCYLTELYYLVTLPERQQIYLKDRELESQHKRMAELHMQAKT